MLSTSTHDTKRSEDVRARINVLSELPHEWRSMIERWAAININVKTHVGGEPAPSRNDEYMMYQTLIGTYQYGIDNDTEFQRRIIRYMHKAINEAKTHSNWINPNAAYAQAIADFMHQIWSSATFRESFVAFQQRIAYFGRINSLAQTLLKLTCPGVPDIYQGNELWDFSLVDPDNRRPVDFELRSDLLQRLRAQAQTDRAALVRELLAESESGAIKLYLIYRTLDYRRRHEALFSDGDYQPVMVQGTHADHISAFLRTDDKDVVLVVVPRLVAILMNGKPGAPIGDLWGNTRLVLPESIGARKLENILTGERVDTKEHVELTEILHTWPVALLALVPDDVNHER
jgi:(1->4)-alpha-D-glucan 1-alpha-D-glucosylmutase